MERFIVGRGAAFMVAFFLAAFTACSDDEPTGPGNGNGGGGGTRVATTSVNVRGNLTFDPADIVVSAGATVTWTWTDPVNHNVTFSNSSITSSANQTTGTFSSVMPTAPGTYAYTCTIHPGMDGSVQVQ